MKKKKLSFQLSEWRSGQKEGDRSWEVCFVPASCCVCVCVWQVKGTRLPIEQVAYNTVNMYSAAKCLICRACRRSRSAMQEESVCPYLLLLRRFVFPLREDGSREKKHVSCVRLTFYACKCHIVVVYGVFLLLALCAHFFFLFYGCFYSHLVGAVCVWENTKLFILQYIDAIALLGQLPLPKLNIIQLNRYYSQSIRRMFDDVCAVFLLFFCSAVEQNIPIQFCKWEVDKNFNNC